MALAAHLGGHADRTHLDHGALKWLIRDFGARSFLDIGCGPGGMVELADRQFNLQALGVDGDHTLDRYDPDKFLTHDFTAGPAPIDREFDVAWSVEFLEHVHAEFIPNYMAAFQRCRFAVVTYAPPGWPGHHHVNCQKEGYWVETFAAFGFAFDAERTKHLRSQSSMNKTWRYYLRTNNIKNKAFVGNRGLFFVNTNR